MIALRGRVQVALNRLGVGWHCESLQPFTAAYWLRAVFSRCMLLDAAFLLTVAVSVLVYRYISAVQYTHHHRQPSGILSKRCIYSYIDFE